MLGGGWGLVAKSGSTLVTSWSVAHQAFPSMGFPREKYWSQLPFPPPGDLPNPGIKPVSPASPALQVDYIPPSHWGSLGIEDMGIEFRTGQIWL